MLTVKFGKENYKKDNADLRSEIERLNKALTETEERYHLVFLRNPQPMMIYELETLFIIDVNEACINQYGYTREEFLKMTVVDIRPKDDVDKFLKHIKSPTHSDVSGVWKHVKKNGEIMYVNIVSHDISYNDQHARHVMVTDITSIKVAKDALNESVTAKKKAEQQVLLLNQSIEQSPVGILVADYEGKAEFCNTRFSQLTGYSQSEVLGSVSKILTHYSDNTDSSNQVWNVLLSGKLWKGEFEDTRKNGEHYWANVAISPIVDNDGSIVHFVMVFEDVTESKLMLEELMKAKVKAEESDRLKTAFLANLSHEIRTPMNGILGFMELLRMQGLSIDLREEYINYVRLSGERLLNTINDIIDISKIESGAIIISESVVDVNDIVRNQYDLFRAEAEIKGLDFKLEGFSNSLSVIIDRKKLESILSNLLRNAVKFTSRGYIHLSYWHEDGKLVFKVSDSGIGIASDRILNIFDRFVQADFSFTRTHEGLGLGLAISKAYADMMGGNINVQSQPDEGSTFILTLPYKLVKDTILEKEPTVEKVTTSINEITILVAEDDEVSYSYLKAIIKKTGIKMIRVTDGQDAVDACMSNPSLSVVFMDIKMPSMDGYEATRQIRKFNTSIPIIALTAFAFSNDREKAILSGCNDYISKPVKKELFLEIINNYSKKE